MPTRKELMLNPPNEVHLYIHFPKSVNTWEDMKKYLWNNFHIDWDIDPESDYYEHLFYNSDLRSMMGFLYGDDFVIFPQYYVDKDDPSSNWSKMWRQLVRQSDILGEGFEVIEEALGKPVEDRWIKEADYWQSTEDEDITVHVALETDEDEPTEYDQMYLVYPAYQNRGIPFSPAIYSEISYGSLEEAYKYAEEEAKRIMKLPIEKIRKFEWSMIK